MADSWAIPTWLFFHALAEKININSYNSKRHELLNIIKHICNNLPCPTCTDHARRYMNSITLDKIKTKEDFKNILFEFHNKVNHRLNKIQFEKKI